jgi:hypothetical protein
LEWFVNIFLFSGPDHAMSVFGHFLTKRYESAELFRMKLKTSLRLMVTTLFLLVLCCLRPARSADEEPKLIGKFYSEMFYGAEGSIDIIEFLPNGECVIDMSDGSGGMTGSYRGIADGKLSLEFGNPRRAHTYKAALKRSILTLTDSRGAESVFVSQPNPPHPKIEEIIGTYRGQRDNGDTMEIFVYKRTPDHMGEVLFRVLSKTRHIFRDFHIIVKWTYANGISLNTLETSDLPPEFRYVHSRDFISKRDQKGLWTVDTASSDIMCETPADKLELPPVPEGFYRPP